MIVCECPLVPKRACPDRRYHFVRERCEPANRLWSVEIRVTDPVDVGGRSPAMRRRRARSLVARRAVPPVGADEDVGAGRLAQLLERERKKYCCARDVPREDPERGCFANICMDNSETVKCRDSCVARACSQEVTS